MLPDTLPIADVVAATLTFDPIMTARDRAIMLAVSWYAGQHRDEAEDGTILIPDLPLRRALGDLRRQDAVWEEARYRRLEHAMARGDGALPDLADGVLVPTIPQGVRRQLFKGKHRWLVEPEIASAFTPYPGDTTVGVPLVILARARSRYTLQLLLRVLAWGSGYHATTWLRRRGDGHRVLRVPLKDLIADLGIGVDVKPADVLRKALMPAIEEIRQLTDIAVDIQPWHAPSIKRPKGRVMGYDILVTDVVTAVVPEERPAAPVIPMQGFKSWTPPGSDDTDIDIAF